MKYYILSEGTFDIRAFISARLVHNHKQIIRLIVYHATIAQKGLTWVAAHHDAIALEVVYAVTTAARKSFSTQGEFFRYHGITCIAVGTC